MRFSRKEYPRTTCWQVFWARSCSGLLWRKAIGALLLPFLIGGLCVSCCGHRRNVELPCLKEYYMSGTVTDNAGNPLSDVWVILVTHDGFEAKFPKISTDTSGKFSNHEGEYADLGGAHYKFTKTGFKDAFSAPFSRGDGTCNDQNIKINIQMQPSP